MVFLYELASKPGSESQRVWVSPRLPHFATHLVYFTASMILHKISNIYNLPMRFGVFWKLMQRRLAAAMRFPNG